MAYPPDPIETRGKKEKKVAKTSYIVLKGNEDGWSYFDIEIEATSAKSAIRIAVQKEGGSAGDYVAIPARSWKVLPVKVETQKLLKIG